MKTDEKEMLTEIQERLDESGFSITFCPVCGSSNLSGLFVGDDLFKKDRADIFCRNCKWSLIVFVNKVGKRRFELRQDSGYGVTGMMQKRLDR